MPPLINQGSAGICYAAVASVMLNQAKCTEEGITDCKRMPDSKRFSTLDLTRFNRDLRKEHSDAKLNPDEIDISDRFNYEGLSLNNGSAGALILYRALRANTSIKESCAPLSQTLSKNNNIRIARQEEMAMWEEIKATYSSYLSKGPQKSEFAKSAADHLKERYNFVASTEDIYNGFAEGSYEKFIDRLLIPDNCWDFKNFVSLKGRWEVKIFPESTTSNFPNTIKKIKSILLQQRPISVSYCLQPTQNHNNFKSCISKDDSSNGHEAVIYGYRRSCKSKNNCVDELRIQNSWGDLWQKMHNDGWVDAKKLLDRTYYERQSLSWIEVRQ